MWLLIAGAAAFSMLAAGLFLVTASTPNERRKRWGGRVVSVPTPASTMINIGDLIYLNSGVAAVASSLSWNSNLATTQADFRQKFLGVAVENKMASDASTREILVQVDGEYEYPCAALGGALHIGQLVGPDKDTGNNLLDQQLVNVSAFAQSIGTLAKEAAQGDTSLTVYLQSWLLFTHQGVAT